MRKILLLIITVTLNAHADINVIYGKDNREDVFKISSPLHKRLASSTAAMIHISQIQRTSKNNFFDLKSVKTLEEGQNICPNEAFSQQATAATCSGFLVSPDTIVTAGHCYSSFDTPENVCKSFAWVFDYHMESETHDPTKNIPLTNIYSCEKVITSQFNNFTDFAVIKLDRKVVGREPLNFRTSGKIANNTSLVVIGHPTGLPTKIANGGKVTRNTSGNTFSATLDTFQGNSGSAVFNARTGVIEGILIQGKTDYILSNPSDPKSCRVVNKCDDFGSNCKANEQGGSVTWGEVVLRISEAVPYIKTASK